ncbi:hypothetical protein J4Q44_G00082340 [Coregonus suidteri]|uniref:Uncharacterized protein n=1 Tax=Coregonus suidteri TaxID=861788 RepID=A0AAN8R2Y6_9TELE
MTKPALGPESATRRQRWKVEVRSAEGRGRHSLYASLPGSSHWSTREARPMPSQSASPRYQRAAEESNAEKKKASVESHAPHLRSGNLSVLKKALGAARSSPKTKTRTAIRRAPHPAPRLSTPPARPKPTHRPSTFTQLSPRDPLSHLRVVKANSRQPLPSIQQAASYSRGGTGEGMERKRSSQREREWRRKS